MPDERWGEAPHAFVVFEAGATATETDLRNYARDHLAHFKAPQKIHFVPELPKTATSKVQKYVLRGKQPPISKQRRLRRLVFLQRCNDVTLLTIQRRR
jgi:fatty-acyl-CoA synthase